MRAVFDTNDKKIDTNESSVTEFCWKYKVEQDKAKKGDWVVTKELSVLSSREEGQFYRELRWKGPKISFGNQKPS